jgi:predicted metal-dependent peptidase
MNAELESNDKIAEAMCLLLAHQPEVGFALLKFDLISSTDVPIMAVGLNRTSTKINCFYNPTQIAKLSVLEIVAILQHEVGHVLLCHCQRVAGRDSLLWNIACDMVVNGKKSDPRIGLMAEDQQSKVIPFFDGLCWIPEYLYPNETTEYYYNWLLEEKKRNPTNSIFTARVLDDHSSWDSMDSEAEVSEVVTAIKKVLQNCLGKSPNGRSARDRVGKDELKISEVESREVPWNVLLRRVLNKLVGSKRGRASHSKRNRRRPVFGVPGTKRVCKPTVNIVLDVSGSVNSDMLGRFFSEISRIGPSIKVNLLLWDTRSQGFYEDFNPRTWRTLTFRGGGGTNMVAPLNWLEENDHVRNLVVVFTDGFVPRWKSESPWPLVTVIVGRGTGPDWGQTIRIPY